MGKDRNVSAIYEVHCRLYKKCKKPVFEFGVKQFVPCSGLPYVKIVKMLIFQAVALILYSQPKMIKQVNCL